MAAILQAVDYSPPYPGTYVRMLNALAETVAGHGYRSVFLFPESVRQQGWFADLAGGGPAVRILPAGVRLAQRAREFARIAREEDAVLLHTHFCSYDIAACAARAMLALRGRKLAVLWHAQSMFLDPRTPARRVKNFMKYRLLGQTVLMVSVSQGVDDDARDVGMPRRNLRLVYNCVDLDRATAARRSAAEVRGQWGVAADERALLIFAWDPLRKGLDTAIDAVESLAGEGLRVALVAVGMDKMDAYLRQRFGDKLPGWLRPAVPTEDVADYYLAADVFLSPSRSEGLSLAVLEALANGRPVVHSDIPGAHWAHDNPAVAFCRPGDGLSLAEAVRSVSAWTPEEAARRTGEGARLVKEEFNLGQWTRRVYRVYEELLGSRVHPSEGATP